LGEESITNPIFIQQPAWPINGGSSPANKPLNRRKSIYKPVFILV
jgi:hypothetical protein